jgi:hypothetical protein
MSNVQHLNILLPVGWRSGQLFHHVPIYHKGKPIKKIFSSNQAVEIVQF